MINKLKTKNEKLKIRLGLLFIVIVAAFLRFYNLSTVPPSASLDEASIGYNAYSILKTGGDEYGTKFPLLLRAYDDWRPAFYVYLVVPFVQLFGLNVFSVRLPSVVLSILTVIAVYFVVLELFRNRGTTQNPSTSLRTDTRNYAETVALFTSFLLAMNPWHIYLSRLGHEVNAALAFFIFSLLFFLKKRIYFASFFITLSFISYQAEKLFIPLIFLSMIPIFKKEILSIKKKSLFLAVCVALVILIPFMKETLSPNALIRFKATGMVETQRERFEKQALLLASSFEKNDFFGKVINNRRILMVQIFSENYISHFNPLWLFFNNSDDRHKVPGLGLFYLWELPLLLVGSWFIFRHKFGNKVKIFILLWILLSPLPGAITSDSPHAMRSYTMLPALEIISGLGLFFILSKFKKDFWKTGLAGFSVVFIFSIFYLSRQYFIAFPKEQSSSFQYALSKAVPFVLENQNPYNKIIFSNEGGLYQSYMFFLFYSKYDPMLYQKQGGTKSGGFAKTHMFDKYEFRPIDWTKEEKDSKTLYIGNIDELPQNLSTFSFKYLDGKDAIRIVPL